MRASITTCDTHRRRVPDGLLQSSVVTAESHTQGEIAHMVGVAEAVSSEEWAAEAVSSGVAASGEVRAWGVGAVAEETSLRAATVGS